MSRSPDDRRSRSSIVLGLDAVIVAVTDEVPRILIVRRPAWTRESWLLGNPRTPRDESEMPTVDPPQPAGLHEAWRAGTPNSGDLPETSSSGLLQPSDPPEMLPSGPLNPAEDRTLERGLRRWVLEQTGLALGYVEQLYTFGDREREVGSPEAEPAASAEPALGPIEATEREDAARLVSVAYLALVHEVRPVPGLEALWRDVYAFLPWEDWRAGRPEVIDDLVAPTLALWEADARSPAERALRHERVAIAFGLGGAGWDAERVLERYELLYEMGLVAESGDPSTRRPAATGRAMALDHRRILATALGRLRGKLRYRPVVFELLPPVFTLWQLQRVVEALAGLRLHKANFRRLVEGGGLVEGTGELAPRTGGRPAELFRFRREVLRERLAPGIGLPGTKVGG